jgi:hypothetical protein
MNMQEGKGRYKNTAYVLCMATPTSAAQFDPVPSHHECRNALKELHWSKRTLWPPLSTYSTAMEEPVACMNTFEWHRETKFAYLGSQDKCMRSQLDWGTHWHLLSTKAAGWLIQGSNS